MSGGRSSRTTISFPLLWEFLFVLTPTESRSDRVRSCIGYPTCQYADHRHRPERARKRSRHHHTAADSKCPHRCGGTASNSFGGDGGFVQSITVDGVTYTFDPSANDGAGGITTGGASFSYDPTTKTLTVDTDTNAVGGEFAMVMTTGAFTFQPPTNFSSETDRLIMCWSTTMATRRAARFISLSPTRNNRQALPESPSTWRSAIPSR